MDSSNLHKIRILPFLIDLVSEENRNAAIYCSCDRTS